METWREIFRNGVGKILPIAGLEKLAEACRSDDPRLRQGATTMPPPLMCVSDWPCEGACAIGYAGWQGGDFAGGPIDRVGQVEKFFAKACFLSDRATGESADIRHFLNWYDDTPRPEMLRELLAECERAIAERKAVAGG